MSRLKLLSLFSDPRTALGEAAAATRRRLGWVLISTAFFTFTTTAASLAPSAAMALLALPHAAPATPIQTGIDATFTIDLGTMVQRPVLEIEAVPDAAHADMALEIELTQFSGLVPVCAVRGPYGTELGVPLTATSSFVSTPATGPQQLAFSFIPCFPDSSVYTGTTVDVRVRAVHFGSGGAPATADIEIRSITLPPFNEFLGAATGPRLLEIDPDPVNGFKDTTIYEDNPTFSNGSGEFLWAGTEVTPIPGSPPLREERRSLLAVDLTNRFPAGSTVNDVEIVLEATSVLGGGGTVSLYEVAVAPTNPWIEGRADGAGDEFDGMNRSPAANWIYRRATTQAWTTPGGEFLAPVLASETITAPGSYAFSSPALAAVVQDMIDLDEDEDGF